MEENQNNLSTESIKESCCGHYDKKINCWKCAFLVVLLFLAVSLAYAGWQFSQKQTTPAVIYPTNAPVASIVPQNTPSPTPDETVTWKTYNNAGVSFKYPSNWVYEKYDIPGRAVLHGLVLLKPENYKSDILVMPLFIEYWDNPEGLTIEQYDKKINQGAGMLYPLYNSQAQLITLGGLTAYYEPKGDCSPFVCHKYVISNRNKIWEISSQYTNDPNEFKPIIDQILSTFKFLE